MIKPKLIITISLIALTTPVLADGQWYQDVYGTSNFNGQVTLTDSSGNPVTASSNPTGTNVDLTQTSSIQPPVVVVQATGGIPCYMVTFNTAFGSNKMLIGTGIVTGSTFTGFLKFTSNPQNSGSTRLQECAASGDCAWANAVISGVGNPYYVVSVSGLPIVSAPAIACY